MRKEHPGLMKAARHSTRNRFAIVGASADAQNRQFV